MLLKLTHTAVWSSFSSSNMLSSSGPVYILYKHLFGVIQSSVTDCCLHLVFTFTLLFYYY